MPTVARSEMLIRASAKRVFEAFVEPAWLKRFWLKDASGPLELNQKIQWKFLVPGATEEVTTAHLVPAERIAFKWSDGKSVDIRFARFGAGATRVTIEVVGFRGKDAVAEAIGATEGFTIVLCALKGLLEGGAPLRLVRDKAKLIAAG
ncbi:MAG: polyketide cyclase [Burkholderiales bacterium]|nr:MAG: polyketide cyclase [Burkholderiales bacterium]